MNNFKFIYLDMMSHYIVVFLYLYQYISHLKPFDSYHLRLHKHVFEIENLHHMLHCMLTIHRTPSMYQFLCK